MINVKQELIKDGRLHKDTTNQGTPAAAGTMYEGAEKRIDMMMFELKDTRYGWEEGDYTDEELILAAEKARQTVYAYRFIGLINQRESDEWDAKIDNLLLTW